MTDLLPHSFRVKSPPIRLTKEMAEVRDFEAIYEAHAAAKNERRKVQLLRPFSVLSPVTLSAAMTLPIGIAYLAAVLEKVGYPVAITDALGEDMFALRKSECGSYNFQGLCTEELVERIDPEAAILGVSMMFSQEWVPHREFIQLVRKKFPHLTIVVGGEHPTALDEYVLRDCPAIDYVVLGEGELTFLELVHSLFNNIDPSGIDGISFIDKDGRYVANGLSKRTVNIDPLPRPAWHHFEVENYFKDNWTMGISKGRNMPILATRGCPYQCTFCSNPKMWTTRYVMRDPIKVVDEIEYLVNEYQANSIEFYDLTAIVKKNWTLELCSELKKRNLDISWQLPSGTRSEALDEESLQALYDTGCCLITYAPESGSKRTLEQIKKRVTLSNLNDSIRTALRIGHTVKINLIIGLPDEKFLDIFKTFLYSLRMSLMGVNDCVVTLFTHYPGSELFNDFRDSGEIVVNDDYFKSLVVMFDLTKWSTSFNKNIPGWFLAGFRILCQSSFYLVSYSYHPKRLFRLIRNIRRPRFEPSNVFEQRVYDYIVRKRLTIKGIRAN